MKPSEILTREEPTSFTPGPWEYIPSTEHHGPYVSGPWGGDICDCYTMSNPNALSVRNGGDSKPIHFQYGQADANARLIAAAPELYEALKNARALWGCRSTDATQLVWLASVDAALAKATGEAK